MSNNDTLYLIDGSGFIFRAYYGIRAPMSATDGTPTNAVYGFMRLLLNVIRDREPAYVGVVFDPPGPTFRNEVFSEYKANRSEPPDDLKPQFGLCRQAVTALGIPALEMSGFEADDVIGTLAQKWVAVAPERKCVIVTADKDIMQLVGPQISMWDGKEKETDRDGVIEKFGVPPERVIDVLGLAGDSSDNIPGVPGIGIKTAATLLTTYNSMSELLERADEVKGKRGENLRNFKEQALLSYELATIKLDVPVELDETALRTSEPDPNELADFCRELNFKRFLKEFDLEDHAVSKVTVDRTAYQTVLTRAQLDDVIRQVRKAGLLSIDLETTSLNTLDAEIVGFAVAWAAGQAAYIPVAHRYDGAPAQLDLEGVADALKPLLEDPEFPKIGQNLKYEWKVLRRCVGIELQGVECDTMLAAYLLDPGRRSFSLDQLSLDLLGHKMVSFSEATSGLEADAGFESVTVESATEYAAEDADITLRLRDELLPKIKAENLGNLNDDIEIPLAEVIGRMEQTGIRIDTGKLSRQSADYGARLTRLTDDIHELADGPFNIDSPKQLAEILFERLGLPAEKKTKTGYSTDQQVLNNLADLHPLPAKVLDYRHLAKLKNTYLDTLPGLVHPGTGRVHSSFRQAVTATGRLSSSDPNLQNIPIRTPEGREIREAFIPEDGWKLLSADYSQIELRLLAHYSKDPGLISSFVDGADIHSRTAAQVFGVDVEQVTGEQRRQAKAVNFGLMYGMSAFRLSNELKIPQRDARGIIRRYFQQYAGVQQYFDEAVQSARDTGKATTLLGRTRALPHINSKSFNLRQQAERLAINTPIQGTAADILKLAMLNLDRRLQAEGLHARMLLTVHDELVLEVPEAELATVPDIVRSEMEQAVELDVPLVVEVGVGANWAEIH